MPTAEALDRRGLLLAAEQVQRALLERMGSFARMVDDQPPGGARPVPDTRFTGSSVPWSPGGSRRTARHL
jgi:hypothetical protein